MRLHIDGAWYLVDTQTDASTYARDGSLYHFFLLGTKNFKHSDPATTFGETISETDYNTSSEDEDETAAEDSDEDTSASGEYDDKSTSASGVSTEKTTAASSGDTEESTSTSSETADEETTAASSEDTEKSTSTSSEAANEETTAAEAADEEQEGEADDAEYIYIYDMVRKPYQIEEIISETEFHHHLYSFAGFTGLAAENYPLPFCKQLCS